jgi:transposase
MAATMSVTAADIRAAQARLAGQVVDTPFLGSRTLSDIAGCEVYLKFENLQFTASFKERGALNKLASLSDTERARGVLAVSAGNHAQGVAYAAQRLGCAKETAYRWIQEFNRIGFRKFDRASHPEGRPSQFSQRQLELLYHIAQKRPTDVGLPFTQWSMTKLHAYLVQQRHFPKISPEWLRRQLHRAKISWQRTKTWKQSHAPQFKPKKACFRTLCTTSEAWSSGLL